MQELGKLLLFFVVPGTRGPGHKCVFQAADGTCWEQAPGSLRQLWDTQGCQSHPLQCPFCRKMREKQGSENPSTSGFYLQEALRWLEQALPLLGAHSRHPGFPLSDMA